VQHTHRLTHKSHCKLTYIIEWLSLNVNTAMTLMAPGALHFVLPPFFMVYTYIHLYINWWNNNYSTCNNRAGGEW